MGSCQHADKGILQFVNRGVLHRLLGNAHGLADRPKQIDLTQLHANGCQTRTRGKMSLGLCERLVHDDGSPLSGFISFDRYGPSSFFWQVPFLRQHSATTLDKI